MLLRLPPRSRTERALDAIERHPATARLLAIVASACVWAIAISTAWEKLS
jgi:hypothetical protein